MPKLVVPKPLRNVSAHTQAVEDYLKAIYDLARQSDRVTTSSLAERLGVSAASVTGMVKKLAASNLVEHVPYSGEIGRAHV